MYSQLIENYARQFGIPPLLALAMMDRESKGNPRAVSPKGALGLMQLMPGTAAEMGVTDPFDPEQSIRGGLGYLRKGYDQYGTWPQAAGYYHSGPGSMEKAGGDVNRLGPQGRAYVAALAPYATDAQRPGLLEQPAPMPAPSMAQEEENMMPDDTLQGLMSNPLFLMGAGILGANTRGSSAGEAIGRGLLGGTAAWQGMQQSRALEEQRRMAIEMAKQKQQQQAMFLRMLQGQGGGMAGAGGAPQDLARLGMTGAVMGVPGAEAVMQYGLSERPYRELNAGQQAEERQREWSREKDVRQMEDEGILPRGGAMPQQDPRSLSLSPRDLREIAKEKEKARTTPTADQRKAAGWVDRMSGVEPEITKLEDDMKKSGGVSYKDYYAAENVMTNALASPQYQAYLAQSREWIAGLLRYESGAAVPEPEFWRYYKTYFQQPGDDARVVEIKRGMRRRAMSGMSTAAGAAMNRDAIPPPPPGFQLEQ